MYVHTHILCCLLNLVCFFSFLFYVCIRIVRVHIRTETAPTPMQALLRGCLFSPRQATSHVPQGPCAQIVYLGPMYLYREFFKAKVHTMWVHGPLGCEMG